MSEVEVIVVDASRKPSSGCLVCRICHTGPNREEALISPCHCKGSLAYVHLSCLEKWLNSSSRDHCELCTYRYTAEPSQRYKLCESARIWFRRPENRVQLQSDLVVAVLLTLVTLGLTVVCLLGKEHFVAECDRYSINTTWTRSCIYVFIGVVILGYCLSMYLLISDQIAPWRRWWRDTTEMRVRLTRSAQLKSAPISPP